MDDQTAPTTPVNPSGTAFVPLTPPPPTNPTPPPNILQPEQVPPSQTTPPKTRSLMLIFSIVVLTAILAGGGYFYVMNIQKSKNEIKPVQTIQILPTMIPTTTPLASPSASASTSANWKIYADPDNYFSFEYPSNWQIEFTDSTPNFQVGGAFENNPKNKKDITITGPEGKFRIRWGDSFGGACGEGYSKLQLKNAEVEICHIVNDEYDGGKEVWRMQETLDKSGIGISISAEANKPTDKNHSTVMKILSSIEIIKKN